MFFKFQIICGVSMVYAMPPHHGGPHHPQPQTFSPKKFASSPIILSNTEWKPLTVVGNNQWTIPVAAPVPAQPQKRESKPQPQPTPIHHQRNVRKIMPEKVVKEKNMADKMSVSLADTFIHGPTAVVRFFYS